jgi:hypothetical protein
VRPSIVSGGLMHCIVTGADASLLTYDERTNGMPFGN